MIGRSCKCAFKIIVVMEWDEVSLRWGGGVVVGICARQCIEQAYYNLCQHLQCLYMLASKVLHQA